MESRAKEEKIIMENEVEEINPRTGKPYVLPKEVRDKMRKPKKSKENYNKPRTAKQIEAQLINSKCGQNPESNAKRSAAAMGHIVSEETKLKISESKKGKPRPEKWVKEKLREGQRKRIQKLKDENPKEESETKS